MNKKEKYIVDVNCVNLVQIIETHIKSSAIIKVLEYLCRFSSK